MNRFRHSWRFQPITFIYYPHNAPGTFDCLNIGIFIFVCVESDMATRGATLTQTELNAQGGNSVVAILSKMLDEPDLELRKQSLEFTLFQTKY